MAVSIGPLRHGSVGLVWTKQYIPQHITPVRDPVKSLAVIFILKPFEPKKWQLYDLRRDSGETNHILDGPC